MTVPSVSRSQPPVAVDQVYRDLRRVDGIRRVRVVEVARGANRRNGCWALCRILDAPRGRADRLWVPVSPRGYLRSDRWAYEPPGKVTPPRDGDEPDAC